MKTNVVNLDNSLKEIDCAFQEVNKFCVYQDLSEKETLRFQLLAEESMGILKNIAGEFKCKFWAENTGKRCELHFQVDTSAPGTSGQGCEGSVRLSCQA